MDRGSAKCNACEAIALTTQSQTTLMIRHLRKSHHKLIDEYDRLNDLKTKVKEAQKKKTNPRKEEQQSILKTRLFPLDPKSKRAMEITLAIAVFICEGLHAVSIVAQVAFISLIYLLEPRYVIPHRTTFPRSVIPKLYNDLKKLLIDKLYEDLPLAESLCITTDVWTSKPGDSYSAFTLQYIDALFRLVWFTAECEPFPGSHSGEAVLEKVNNFVHRMGILKHNVSIYIV